MNKRLKLWSKIKTMRIKVGAMQLNDYHNLKVNERVLLDYIHRMLSDLSGSLVKP